MRRAVLCFGSLSVIAMGAESAPSATAEEIPPIFARREGGNDGRLSAGAGPREAVKPRPKTVSPELAAKISSVIVRPKSAEPGVAGAGSMTPLVVEDPAVVRLERYVVRERRLPNFKDRDILTLKGKAALARQRYPGAGAAALAMLEEDFANERRQEAADLSALAALRGTELPRDVKRQMKDASMRRGEFTPSFGGPR